MALHQVVTPKLGAHSLRQVEHDPEKWKPVFPRDKRETRLSEIMLKQSDEIMMRFHFIAS